MKLKLAVALAVLAILSVSAAAPQQARQKRQEYKVVFMKVDGVGQWVPGPGNVMVEVRGPARSAEAMTKQFNDLAGDGWKYHGIMMTSSEGVFLLFERQK